MLKEHQIALDKQTREQTREQNEKFKEQNKKFEEQNEKFEEQNEKLDLVLDWVKSQQDSKAKPKSRK